MLYSSRDSNIFRYRDGKKSKTPSLTDIIVRLMLFCSVMERGAAPTMTQALIATKIQYVVLYDYRRNIAKFVPNPKSKRLQANGRVEIVVIPTVQFT